MRNIILLIALLIAAKSFAVKTYSVVTEIVERDTDNELSFTKKKLKNLLSTDKFEGKYFKIVKGTGDDPILNDGSLDAQKAANVYYHLEKARDYFVSIGGVQDYQAVIRIDIINFQHSSWHFVNPNTIDSVSKEKPQKFNNAETISKGTGDMSLGVKPWGNEIWFRPPKKVKISNEDKAEFKKMIKGSLPKNTSFNIDMLTFSGIEAFFAEDTEESLKTNAESILTNYLRDSAIRWAIPEIATLIISYQSAFLDTAFIPGIIYHEYTHLVMADVLPPVVNNPFIEGYADFFAIKVANTDKFANDLGEYGSNFKERTSESEIVFEESLNEKLGSDFMLSLLFDLEKKITELEGDPAYFSKKLYQMRKIMTVDSDISVDLGDLLWATFPKYRRVIIGMMANRGI